VGLKAEWNNFWLNLKERDHIIVLEAEEKMPLYMISVLTAVSIIDTDVNCTAAFNIQITAIFKYFHVARISICFHEHISRSTVQKFLLYIMPQVQP
jgi:hypothetical protein